MIAYHIISAQDGSSFTGAGVVAVGFAMGVAAAAARSARAQAPRGDFSSIRERGSAPRNPAPRNHFLVWIVQPSGCQCTDAFGGK